MKSIQLQNFRITRILLLAVTLAFIAAGSTGAWGQATTSLCGTVTEQSGSAVAGATVVLSNVEAKTERTTTTGTQGEYQFLFVPPGTYTLTVTAKGFARHEETGLQLLVNTPATANVQLKIGQVTESITVSSEAPPWTWSTPLLETPSMKLR